MRVLSVVRKGVGEARALTDHTHLNLFYDVRLQRLLILAIQNFLVNAAHRRCLGGVQCVIVACAVCLRCLPLFGSQVTCSTG